jgi:hypothetical protein
MNEVYSEDPNVCFHVDVAAGLTLDVRLPSSVVGCRLNVVVAPMFNRNSDVLVDS